MLLALCQDVSRWVCTSTDFPNPARFPASQVHYWSEGGRFFGGFDIPDHIDPEDVVSVNIEDLATTKYGYADPWTVAHLVGEEVREALTSLGAEDVRPGDFGYFDVVAAQPDPYDGPFYRGRTSDMITLLCHDLADLLKVNGGRYYTPARVAKGSVYYWVAGGRVFGDRELPGWISALEAVDVTCSCSLSG